MTKEELFLQQKDTLDKFLERNAISKAQYDKSLGDIIKKMEMSEVLKRMQNHPTNLKDRE